MKIKINNDDIRAYLDIEKINLDKYVSPLINLANQYAQGTRPKVVGQMSELIQQFNGKTISEWKQWYLANNPDAIENATKKIWTKIQELKGTINNINESDVEKWVEDLVIIKTFTGLKFQEVILKKAAEIKNTTYRLSNPDEESRGIDGFIGDIPVSIKPTTYKLESALKEQIEVKIIFYQKLKDGIEVDYGEII
ncbi:MAG TPA: MjaI family restriction endonuclease [Bacteroidales bacterium]|nr:MjaI family restriction endonuclease [Bacteroidales bacterium]HQJ58617.1 MjaI family restriction endonuclease [Bacteroidales bacterium]